jgi:hypothetical protein
VCDDVTVLVHTLRQQQQQQGAREAERHVRGLCQRVTAEFEFITSEHAAVAPHPTPSAAH